MVLRSRSDVGRLAHRLSVLGLVAIIEAVYVVVVSAGKPWPWPSYMAYYDLLAEGFRAGHLHIALEPPPELLAAADPFDPRNARYWLGDVSLHGGHYYFYWGPVPGLIVAVVKSLFGLQQPFGDERLVLGFFSLSAVAGTALLDQVRNRLFPRLPGWLFALSVLAWGLGTPVPYLLASTSVYQAAISGGQGFLVLGLACAFSASRPGRAEVARLTRLGLAGASWVAAIGCRVSLAPAVGLLVVTTIALSEETLRRPLLPRCWRDGVVLGTPVALGCGGLLLYNRLRFGAWLESGVRLQLTGWPFRFSPRYIVANLHQYLFRPPILTCRFPYAVVPYGVDAAAALPGWIPFRDGYMTPEPLAGMAWAFPLVWAAPIAVVVGVSILRRRLRREGVEPESESRARWSRDLVWCVASFGILSMVPWVAPLGLYLATMRYLGDVRSGLGLLGALGLWALWGRASRRWQRRCAVGLGVGLTLTTIALGLLLGFQGYTGHFRRFNPELSARLERSLSVCD